MKKVLVFCEVRSKNELIPTVCHTILINRPVSEVILFPISRQELCCIGSRLPKLGLLAFANRQYCINNLFCIKFGLDHASYLQCYFLLLDKSIPILRAFWEPLTGNKIITVLAALRRHIAFSRCFIFAD